MVSSTPVKQKEEMHAERRLAVSLSSPSHTPPSPPSPLRMLSCAGRWSSSRRRSEGRTRIRYGRRCTISITRCRKRLRPDPLG